MAVEAAGLATAALEFEQRSTKAAATRAQRIGCLAGNAAEQIHRTLEQRLCERTTP